MTTPTPAPRIRWHDSRDGASDPAFTGDVGDLHALFKIWPPEDPGDEWLLTTALPGMLEARCYSYPDDLKIEAEHWLTKFVASLGAIFPAPSVLVCESCGKPVERTFDDEYQHTTTQAGISCTVYPVVAVRSDRTEAGR